MILNLSDNKSITKFYNNLWIYKSIIFYKTKFICNDNVDLQTKYIIESLNIKNRKKELLLFLIKLVN